MTVYCPPTRSLANSEDSDDNDSICPLAKDGDYVDGTNNVLKEDEMEIENDEDDEIGANHFEVEDIDLHAK
jgi:hypothetical protein